MYLQVLITSLNNTSQGSAEFHKSITIIASKNSGYIMSIIYQKTRPFSILSQLNLMTVCQVEHKTNDVTDSIATL